MKKLVCALLVVAQVVSGCSLFPAKPEGNKTADAVDQAASLHTSITSITPWADIKEKLKPNFTLSPGDALNKSIPTTLVRLDRALDILKLQLSLSSGAALPSPTTSSTSSAAASSASSAPSKSASAPAATTSSPASSTTASTSDGTSSGVDATADALLQYQTAANLLRDIAVLNSEIDNVSRRRGQDAFLTRIQVSVMPLRHGLGYDVYANLSMFGSTGGFDPDTGAPKPGQLLDGTPLVIPILSTDSLQASRRSLSSTVSSDVGLALTLLKGVGDAGASGSKSHEHDSQANGNDLEAVVTVGRLSDNTIRIRMGADPLPGGGYGMVPRTFNVSAVVFLPKKTKEIYYFSRLSLHHVIDGTELSTVRTPTYDQSITDLVAHYNKFLPNTKLTEELMGSKLNAYAFSGDFKSFADAMKQVTTGTPGYQPEFEREEMYLWAELIALNRHAHFAYSVVDVPRPEDMQWPPTNQLVAYSSDAKGVSVSLGMGKGLRASAIDARLVLRPCAPAALVASAALPSIPKAPKGKSTKKAGIPATTTSSGGAQSAVVAPCLATSGDQSTVQATSVTTSTDGRSATFQFPPVDQLSDLQTPTQKLTPLKLLLTSIEQNGATAPPDPYVFTALRTVKPADTDKDPSSAASLTPGSRVVVADKARQGRIVFTVQGGSKPSLKAIVHQSVLTFTDDAGKAVTHKGSSWDVVDGGRYIVKLDNLSTTAVVQIELVTQPEDSKPSSLFSTEVRVEELGKR